MDRPSKQAPMEEEKADAPYDNGETRSAGTRTTSHSGRPDMMDTVVKAHDPELRPANAWPDRT